MVAGEVLESCGSTNDLAKQKGALGPNAAPHGTYVSARIQTSGRGRLGRSWQCEPGNLFLSIILRPVETRYWTWIPLMGAVGVMELLASGEFGSWPSSRFTIKWPNDLWMDRKKLGGILCEAVSSNSASPFVVLGLGLNCARAPGGLDQETASLQDPALAEQLRVPLVEWISRECLRLDREGPGVIRELYGRWAEFQQGDRISWKCDAQTLHATVQGLGESGELQVDLPDGRRRSLYAEEVFGVRR